MYNTETSNSDRIWTSQDLNIDFRPIFIMNRCFLVKPKANPFGSWAKIWYFSKPLNMYIHTEGFTWLKYNFPTSFCHKQKFFGKTEG
jgi:hypothetical protein